MTTMAMIANTTWRVANAYGSAEIRVLDAENTTKNPMIVSANWTAINTQSTLRLGSAGLAPMLPRPESGLRERNEVATSGYSIVRMLEKRPS